MEFYSCWWIPLSLPLGSESLCDSPLRRINLFGIRPLHRKFTRCQNCDFPRFRRSQLAIGLFYLDHCTAQILRNSPVNEMMHNDSGYSKTSSFSAFNFLLDQLGIFMVLRKKKESVWLHAQLLAIIRRYRSIKSIARSFTPDLFIRSIDEHERV